MVAKVSSDFTVNINGQNTVFFFRRPNQSELFDIDLQYRKIYSEALRNGVMTESEAKKLFKNSNSWGKEEEEKISSIALDIAQRQRVLENFKDSPKKEVLDAINTIIGLRNELIELVGQRTQMFAQTAEGIANEQRIHKIIELCLIEKVSNEPFFDGFENYKSFASSNVDALSSFYKEAWMFEYNTNANIEEDYPEMKLLKEMAEKEKTEVETKTPEQPKVDEVLPVIGKTEE